MRSTPWLPRGMASQIFQPCPTHLEAGIDCILEDQSSQNHLASHAKWFVGLVSAYLQMHMFSLRILYPPSPPRGAAFYHVYASVLGSERLGAGPLRERSVSSEVKRPTRVLNVLWPRKYLSVTHCWQMICRGSKRPLASWDVGVWNISGLHCNIFA